MTLPRRSTGRIITTTTTTAPAANTVTINTCLSMAVGKTGGTVILNEEEFERNVLLPQKQDQSVSLSSSSSSS
eukprot:CAMPEP_0202465624 /NCGR_PEP_ID=MMETSP1360-20130828/66168_1 /ASSEMBLY_ACC=CAM_ASM_000848 /TAXON_ID=515479 /ORGANISM="Licmophora paradoxa, Strain CCMP2313" /LENGTH=72 /DNA_ID=CAMNT_0049089421 /DNA_START=46 /DNA_END=261 /DNA_ORIENTATION=-